MDKVSYLLKALQTERMAWEAAANKEGRTLAGWIRQTLNKSARKMNIKGEQMVLLTREAVEKECSSSEIRDKWSLLVKNNDNYICRRCNKHLSRTGSVAQSHHIIPVSEGGMHTIDNGVTLCRSCHRHVHVKIRKGIGYMEALSVPK